MPDSPLAKKLQIKPHQKLLVLHAPEGYLESLRPLPEGVTAAHRATGTSDVVQLFVTDAADVAKRAPAALKALRPGGVLWVCWPKQSSGIRTDLNRDRLWDAMRPLGLRPVANVSIADTWSALRFKPA